MTGINGVRFTFRPLDPLNDAELLHRWVTHPKAQFRAIRRKVPRNKRTLITVWVSPCKGRPGDPVTLWRGRRKMGSRRLDRAGRPRRAARSGDRGLCRPRHR